MTLTANEPLTQETGQFNALPAAASATVYQGSVCTLNSDGYIPTGGFNAGDPFVGHCDAKCDNSSGAAGAKNVNLLTGRYRLEVTLSTNLNDIGKDVYASANDTYTLDPAGASGPYTKVGKVHRRVSSTVAIVEFDANPGTGVAAVSPASKVHFFEDFLGLAILTNETGSTGIWEDVLVGTSGNSKVQTKADEHGGALQLLIAADNEAEDAVLYFGDQLHFDIDLLETFRMRFKAITPGTGVRIVAGMAGDHNLDKDTVAQNAWFSLDAGLDLKAETDDGTNNNDDVAISTIVTDTWYEAEIDFRDPSDVKFYLNGTRVATGTTFDMSNYTGGLQPYFSADKASGTGTGQLIVDYVEVIASRA